ncbi:MAG: hypothetical protein K0R76_894 [Alphaproteobacteria bacterium]|nr:hypothetical protein [Alphaproteobacteria bacterium]
MNTMTILTDADLETICGGRSTLIINTATGEYLPVEASEALQSAGVLSPADPTLGVLVLEVTLPPPPTPK